MIVFDTSELSFLCILPVREAHLAGGKKHCITALILDSKLKKKAKDRLRHVSKKSIEVVSAIKTMSEEESRRKGDYIT